MKKKALIKYEGNTYWLDMTKGFPTLETLDPDGTFHDTLKSEVNFIDVMWWGHVIADEKPRVN